MDVESDYKTGLRVGGKRGPWGLPFQPHPEGIAVVAVPGGREAHYRLRLECAVRAVVGNVSPAFDADGALDVSILARALEDEWSATQCPHVLAASRVARALYVDSHPEGVPVDELDRWAQVARGALMAHLAAAIVHGPPSPSQREERAKAEAVRIGAGRDIAGAVEIDVLTLAARIEELLRAGAGGVVFHPETVRTVEVNVGKRLRREFDRMEQDAAAGQ